MRHLRWAAPPDTAILARLPRLRTRSRTCRPTKAGGRKAVVEDGAHVAIFGPRVCSAIRMQCDEQWSGKALADLVRIFVCHSAPKG